jgi:enoyl-CoA hydratase
MFVTYERDDDVAVITLHREPLNTYDDAFHVAFQGAWKAAKADDTKAVVMRAIGKHFCAGAEMKTPQPAPDGADILSPGDEMRLIRGVMKPTIAEDAFFRDPTATMGIGGIQSHLHSWFYGPRLAKEMIYSGMRLPAQRLYAMGQVNRLLPDVETLHREAMAFAHEVAQQDPVALRQAKRAADITMDIQGQHYVVSRMEELLDDFPQMNLGLPPG